MVGLTFWAKHLKQMLCIIIMLQIAFRHPLCVTHV